MEQIEAQTYRVCVLAEKLGITIAEARELKYGKKAKTKKTSAIMDKSKEIKDGSISPDRQG